MNTEDIEQPINRLSEAAIEATHRTAAEVQNQLQAARDKTGDVITRGQTWVRENPVTSIVGMLAIGLTAGYVMAHREQPSFRRRYIEDPMHHTQDALYGLLAPALAKLSEQYSSARSAAEDALDKLHHQSSRTVEPWLSRIGSNLKFW